MIKYTGLIALASILLIGCSTPRYESPRQSSVQIQQTTASDIRAVRSKRSQLKRSIVNDYNTYQSLNYEQIHQMNIDDQLIVMEEIIRDMVMELVEDLKADIFENSLIIRPISKDDKTLAADSGILLVEETLETQFKNMGFTVFDDRKPKGKLEGTELILDPQLFILNSRYYLNLTMKTLDSNKMLATSRNVIGNYFFIEIQDGVEVYKRDELGVFRELDVHF